jgi:transposase
VGGKTTKIHMACDALGNPLPLFCLSRGEVHDSQRAREVIRYYPAKYWVADKAYLDGKIRRLIESQGGEVVIPPKSNAKEPWDYDEAIYRIRHLIENCFQRLKCFRRVSTRYEKMAINYAGFVSMACVLIWLR